MKSTTSRSDLPAASCSRIWLRRSMASGAFESASVWFWQTRQRSSWERLVTRRSSTGSCASTQLAQSANSSLATGVQFPHQRLDLLLHDVRAKRADVLVADHALAVDDVGLGHAVHAVVDADAAVGIEHDQLIRVAVALEPGQRVVARVLVVQPDHGSEPGLRDARHHRVLDQARRAPRRPHVHDPHLAEHVLLRETLVGLGKQRQLERRRRLADQRRRYLARIEAQADREQRDQRDEDAERPERSLHAVTSAARLWGRTTRYLRSLAASSPPSAMMRQPTKIQSMKGLCCTFTSHEPSSNGSPSDT